MPQQSPDDEQRAPNRFEELLAQAATDTRFGIQVRPEELDQVWRAARDLVPKLVPDATSEQVEALLTRVVDPVFQILNSDLGRIGELQLHVQGLQRAKAELLINAVQVSKELREIKAHLGLRDAAGDGNVPDAG